MDAIFFVEKARMSSRSQNALNAAAAFWWLVATAGMWMFVYYVSAYYGAMLWEAGITVLKETHLPNGYIEGDALGNFAVASHLLLAIVIIGFGPLQLVPFIRREYPRTHRVLGRAYLVTAVLSAIAGLFMVWTRGTVGGPVLLYAISLDGILIIVFAALAVRFAMARNLYRHRRWALRLFMVTSGVWFYRVGLMAWVGLTGGIGVDFETFTGPFLVVLAYGQYLLPLALLELYLYYRDNGPGSARWLTAGAIFVATLVMGVGIVFASMGMWLPRISG